MSIFPTSSTPSPTSRTLRQDRPVRRGFSLVELLVVMGIITILMAMVVGAAFAARQNAFRGKAQAEIRELTNAMKAYAISYGGWPPEIQAAWANAETPIQMGETTLQSLRGVDTGDTGSNQREIVFLELSDRQLRNGMYVDPWGTPYEMYFTTMGQADLPKMLFYFKTAVSFPMRDRYRYDKTW